MLEELKQSVIEANMYLPKYNLVTLTWGNVSAVDREKELIVIKPSGVPYEKLSLENMVVVDFEGKVIDGKYSPSSDTPTHLELYKEFPQIGGIVHTHSLYATSWAQAGRSIPLYGTTHADYFFDEIPCSRGLIEGEIMSEYEKNTGLVIIETFKKMQKNPIHTPGILCTNHGPFAWGKDALEALHNAVVLEEIAKMAYITETLNKNVKQAPGYLRNKHFYRKHGEKAYYGQKNASY